MQFWFEHSMTQKYRGLIIAPDIFIWRILALGFICFLSLSSLLPYGRVNGQAEDTLLVQAPDTSAFPTISIQFKLPESVDIAGEDLEAAQISVLEDGREVTIQSLQRAPRGVHFTLAINGGRDLDLRDEAGISNFEKMRGVLREWASRREDFPEDSWSLLINGSANLINIVKKEDWLGALMASAPDFRSIAPDLSSLSTAIQYAETRVVPFGVDKAVLYLTPPPDVSQINEISTLAENARSAGIQVNVWMVGDPLFLNNNQGEVLISLADRTGGAFYHFSGSETLPDSSSLLSNLGFIYTIQYESLVRKTGSYPLEIAVNSAGETLRGESSPFYINVQPPEPVLVNPPSDLHRDAGTENQVNSGALDDEDLKVVSFPAIEPVKFSVHFPDGYPREIVSCRLYVNGVLVSVNDSPPFDELRWDLSEFTQSGEQIIQVEVTDSLGLSGLTNEYPVQLVVVAPEIEPETSPRQWIFLFGGILLGLGILSALVWFAIWLIRRANLKRVKGILARHAIKNTKLREDPDIKSKEIHATLIPLGHLDQGWETQAIRVTELDGIFGSRSGHVDYLLQEDGVDEIQARLVLRDGVFWLNDLESALGTWVNYRRIGTKPVKIHPGDLIHLGNSGFRFTMGNKSLAAPVRITPYEPIL